MKEKYYNLVFDEQNVGVVKVTQGAPPPLLDIKIAIESHLDEEVEILSCEEEDGTIVVRIRGEYLGEDYLAGEETWLYI